MDYILSIINIIVLLFLALLHLYWVFNGQLGIADSVPTKLSGMRVFKPSRFGTFLVALILFAFTAINMAFAQIVVLPITSYSLDMLMGGIALVFLLRFIGDFKYMGITKRYRKSRFAKRDTYLYNPVCLFLSVSHALLFN